MKYTLHQLEIFSKVVELRSITKASKELFLTQPAVSIQIKKFQEQFARPLFEVVSRQLYITDFGKEVANSAHKILDEVAELNLRTHSYDGQLAGKLKIAIVSTAKYVMPFFLKKFIDQHEKVNVYIDVTNKSSVIKSLEANQVDFGLVSVIPDKLNINRVQLMENKLYLVGGKNCINTEDVLTKKDIASLPMLYREQGSATRKVMEKYIADNGLPGKQRLELTSNEAIKQAIIAGLGYSIMPIIGIKNELENGDIKIIPVNNLPLITNWNLIWLKSKKLSLTSNAFIEYLQEQKLKIIDESFDWFEKY